MSGLVSAINFLSIISIPSKRGRSEAELKGAARFFPLVGLLFGLILALLDIGLRMVLPLMAASILLIAASTILSGAIHLDGLADTLDGILGGGGDRVRSLQIMRDSSLGTFGAASLSLDLILKFVLIASLHGRLRFLALLLFPLVARGALVFSMVLFPCARGDGKAKSFDSFKDIKSLSIPIILLLSSIFFCPLSVLATLVTLLLSFLISYLLNKRLGGLTGDTYGAVVELSEISFLLIFLIGARP
ncbi:MAG: adenosylcobinamide-GDP ribazoletransferase [Actinomycetota bacterium]|nr:adenosylcobinamide-GDP ribazoletransferase [Actinomycetota bacterium]